MPRAPANPDPLIESYTRQRDGKVFEIHARRSGLYAIYLDGKVVDSGSDQLQGFAHGRYPSNRRQTDVMAIAKRAIETRPLDGEG